MRVAGVFVMYGLLLFVEAGLTYRKTGGRPSLIAGMISGALLMLSATLILAEVAIGPSIGLGVTLAMLGNYGSRYSKTRIFMPAGVMLGASVVALAILFTQMFS